jgi:integrase/recombinase XerD
MSSVYSKRNILYISWYDWSSGKSRNRSTKLPDTKENTVIVNKMAVDLQKELDKKKDEYKKNQIVKNVSIGSAFNHFLRNNTSKHKKTIFEYNHFFKLFKNKFDENAACTIIDKLSVEDWLNGVKLLKFQQNTLHTYYKQCNHFLNFLFEYSYVPMFKINKDVKIRSEIKEIITFSEDDLNKIFGGLADKNSNFKTMVYLAYYTGLRSSDLLTITGSRVDILNRILTYYSPKTKKYFQIPFHKDLDKILAERIKDVGSGQLICFQNASNMSLAFRRYLKSLGLFGTGYSMRIFRKTFISQASHTMDLSTVSKLVGHASINTTAKYYNKVDLERKTTELEKFKGIKDAN